MNNYDEKINMGYKDLIAWQKAILLVEEIYKITSCFPKNEMFGLVSQMRRSAISVPSNIAEGYGRNSKNFFSLFLKISLGSASELETQLIISKRLGFLGENFYKLEKQIIEIKKILTILIKTNN